ncbi:hypothetical protein VP409E501_P0067 [Vibrio phage 409E50-1]|nr:hypothetical protein VP521E561_P0067 [Vibrio phage 521E56-1]CAH9012959.1 hypothetical protein VP384E501_P0067 [Vibrio phage 384E50-1]CAH9012996.1 hypothetical protein VP409E501_P0067 [Vibrio phage 409E50-1]CAH9013045.1 hypothetical protein VP402E501_P0067 [Vibrio phage 402E50-1]CAH9013788.1 hypothetical protein VP405E501_P0067 [Vibrio phage 405E50-1]CAH9013840.1 hypothetical protein VP413E501_P0067 [Vibrio phage 413E50-1]
MTVVKTHGRSSYQIKGNLHLPTSPLLYDCQSNTTRSHNHLKLCIKCETLTRFPHPHVNA